MEKKSSGISNIFKGLFSSRGKAEKHDPDIPEIDGDLSSEEQDLQDKYASYGKNYSERGLIEKIKNIAEKVGNKTIDSVIWLWIAANPNNNYVSNKQRALIYCILGYLILPLDLIPDLMPGGFVDDMAAIASLITTLSCLPSDVKEKLDAEVQVKKQEIFKK